MLDLTLDRRCLLPLGAAAGAGLGQSVCVGNKPGAEAAIGVGGTPADFAKFIASGQQRWKLVAARARIEPDWAAPAAVTGRLHPVMDAL